MPEVSRDDIDAFKAEMRGMFDAQLELLSGRLENRAGDLKNEIGEIENRMTRALDDIGKAAEETAARVARDTANSTVTWKSWIGHISAVGASIAAGLAMVAIFIDTRIENSVLTAFSRIVGIPAEVELADDAPDGLISRLPEGIAAFVTPGPRGIEDFDPDESLLAQVSAWQDMTATGLLDRQAALETRFEDQWSALDDWRLTTTDDVTTGYMMAGSLLDERSAEWFSDWNARWSASQSRIASEAAEEATRAASRRVAVMVLLALASDVSTVDDPDPTVRQNHALAVRENLRELSENFDTIAQGGADGMEGDRLEALIAIRRIMQTYEYTDARTAFDYASILLDSDFFVRQVERGLVGNLDQRFCQVAAVFALTADRTTIADVETMGKLDDVTRLRQDHLPACFLLHWILSSETEQDNIVARLESRLSAEGGPMTAGAELRALTGYLGQLVNDEDRDLGAGKSLVVAMRERLLGLMETGGARAALAEDRPAPVQGPETE
ncbi:hypothetical protein HKCCE2091_19830 [Rhodobacterales bacterium HKCCE2091]|nr:hypothetical protein [Rhodobacterales bacterium HKCCE2091]